MDHAGILSLISFSYRMNYHVNLDLNSLTTPEYYYNLEELRREATQHITDHRPLSLRCLLVRNRQSIHLTLPEYHYIQGSFDIEKLKLCEMLSLLSKQRSIEDAYASADHYAYPLPPISLFSDELIEISDSDSSNIEPLCMKKIFLLHTKKYLFICFFFLGVPASPSIVSPLPTAASVEVAPKFDLSHPTDISPTSPPVPVLPPPPDSTSAEPFIHDVAAYETILSVSGTSHDLDPFSTDTVVFPDPVTPNSLKEAAQSPDLDPFTTDIVVYPDPVTPDTLKEAAQTPDMPSLFDDMSYVDDDSEIYHLLDDIFDKA